MEKAAKTKRVPYDSGIDSFPANLSIDYVNQQKEKYKEKLLKSQEKVLRYERKQFLCQIDFSIRHNSDSFTFTPRHLDDKHKLIFVQEIMDKFEGRVFGKCDLFSSSIKLKEPQLYATYEICLGCTDRATSPIIQPGKYDEYEEWLQTQFSSK